MFHALRASRLTPIWVLLGTLLIVGFAAAAAGRANVPATGLVAAYVDVNGNGVDDTCETGDIVADPDAEAAADAAVDLDGNGTISVSEAAQSDRIGGVNCNHGGYVSWVAQGSCADPTPTATPEQPALVTGDAPEDTTEEVAADTTCDETAAQPTETPTDATEEAADTTCVEVPPPDHDPALDEQQNGHGKWVSTVAQSDATGGKNCNHGGAVSEAAKMDHEAAKAARDAAKAEREAAREARKAARDAAKAARGHGKGNPHQD